MVTKNSNQKGKAKGKGKKVGAQRGEGEAPSGSSSRGLVLGDWSVELHGLGLWSHLVLESWFPLW